MPLDREKLRKICSLYTCTEYLKLLSSVSYLDLRELWFEPLPPTPRCLPHRRREIIMFMNAIMNAIASVFSSTWNFFRMLIRTSDESIPMLYFRFRDGIGRGGKGRAGKPVFHALSLL